MCQLQEWSLLLPAITASPPGLLSLSLSCWGRRFSVTSPNFRGWHLSSVMSCTDTMLRTGNNLHLFCFTELYKMRSRRRSLHLPPKISVRCDDSEWAFTALRNKRKAEHKPTRLFSQCMGNGLHPLLSKPPAHCRAEATASRAQTR